MGVGIAVSAPTGRGLTAITEQLAALAGDVADRLDRLAVGIPGRVDAGRGVVAGAVNLGIDEPVELAALLGDRLGVPVHVENDVSAAALGMFHHLALPAGGSLAYVNVGTGIDCTIRELAETIARVTGFGGRLTFDTTKPDGTPRKLMDVSRLKALGWQAGIGLEDGLRDAYRWYVENVEQARAR